jgi:hypothetical protein
VALRPSLCIQSIMEEAVTSTPQLEHPGHPLVVNAFAVSFALPNTRALDCAIAFEIPAACIHCRCFFQLAGCWNSVPRAYNTRPEKSKCGSGTSPPPAFGHHHHGRPHPHAIVIPCTSSPSAAAAAASGGATGWFISGQSS